MDATSTAELTIRMIVGLVVVLGMLGLGTRLARRRMGRTIDIDIDVCGRQVLSKASSIAVVRVGRRHLLLGVNDNGISLLAEGDDLLGSPSHPTSSSTTTTSSTSTTPPTTTRTTSNPARPGPAQDPAADKPGTDVVDIRTGVLQALRERTVRRT